MEHFIALSNHDRRKHLIPVCRVWHGTEEIYRRNLTALVFNAQVPPDLNPGGSMQRAIMGLSRATSENVPLVNCGGHPAKIVVASGSTICRRSMCVDSSFMLLEALAEVGSHGLTALHYAGLSDNLELITAGLLAGVPLDVQDGFGNTPLMYAAASLSSNAVARLVALGADPMKANNTGAVPSSSTINPELSQLVLMKTTHGASQSKAAAAKKKM